MTLQFRRHTGSTDLVYTVKGSYDLLSWDPLPESLVVETADLGDGTEMVTVRDQSAAETLRRFLRVDVALATPTE